MIEHDIEETIRKRAYEIWEYRRDNGVKFVLTYPGVIREITSQDDWEEAKYQILNERQK